MALRVGGGKGGGVDGPGQEITICVALEGSISYGLCHFVDLAAQFPPTVYNLQEIQSVFASLLSFYYTLCAVAYYI